MDDTLIYSIIWYIIGVSSFVYWWTSEYDLTLGGCILATFIGVFGPFAFIMGYFKHGKTSITLIKKRGE